jgi:hypothetical protein
MDAAPWEKDPIVQPAASAAPWEKDPVVRAAPAASPGDGPDLAPPAPGVNLYQNGNLATPAAAPVAPQDPNRDADLAMQAANKGAYADTLGIPVDLAAGALNAGSAAVNIGGHILGNPNDTTGYVRNPIGGSQNISDVGGAAFQAATGRPAINPADMTPDELARYRTIEMGANAATTEGFGKIFSELAGLARPADVAPATSNRVQVFSPADAGPTPRSVGSAAIAGAGAGVAQQAYDRYGKPIVKQTPFVGPELDALLDAASGYGGAIGAGAATSAAKVASIPARAVVDKVIGDNRGFTLQDGTRTSAKNLDVAADTYQSAAINPSKAAGAIADSTNTQRSMGPVTTTTGATSTDPGLISFEQKLRMDPTLSRKFIQNDQQVQQAARTDVNTIAPETAVGRTFTDTANWMDKQKVANAEADVTATKQTINNLEQQQSADARPIEDAKNTHVPASQALDKVLVDKTLTPMQQKSAAMFDAVDPNREAVVSADPLIEAAAKVKNSLGDFNAPEKVLPAGLLARIAKTQPKSELDPETEAQISQMSPKAQAQIREQLGANPEQLGANPEPATTSIGDIVKVYPELATTEQRARRAQNYALADNIRDLRKAYDGVIEDSASASIDAYHGSPKVFDKFDPAARGANTGLLSAKEAYFFGGPKTAESFSKGQLEDLEIEPDDPRFLDSLRGKATPEQMANVEQLVQNLGKHPDAFGDAYRAGQDILEGNRPNIRRATLRVSNPLKVDMGGRWTEEGEEQAMAKAKSGGHDALIMENWNPNPDGEQTPIYAIFDHGKIRPAGDGKTVPPETLAAGRAAMAAKQNWQDTIGKTFSDGPGGPATEFRKDVNLDKFQRSDSPPSQTAGRFLQPQQPEKAESLKNILNASEDKPAGQRAAGQYLTADLAASGAVKDGKVDPTALATWRAKWGESTLDTAPAFKKQLDNLQANATANEQKSSQLAQQLKAHEATLHDAEVNKGAFQHVLGKDPATAVDGIFRSGDPERAMQEIMDKIGTGTAAHDGLKAAVREYLVEKATTSALQKTTTGDNPISFAKLDTLFKQNQKTLAAVLSPDEMHSLQVAHTRLKAINNLAQQALPGSPTAEREGMVKKLWTAAEIVLKSTYGGLEGGNKVRNLKLAAAMQGGGPNAVYKTLAEAQFNPELAQVLAKRDVSKGGRTKYDGKLFNRITLPAAVARNNVDQQQAQ